MSEDGFIDILNDDSPSLEKKAGKGSLRGKSGRAEQQSASAKKRARASQDVVDEGVPPKDKGEAYDEDEEKEEEEKEVEKGSDEAGAGGDDDDDDDDDDDEIDEEEEEEGMVEEEVGGGKKRRGGKRLAGAGAGVKKKKQAGAKKNVQGGAGSKNEGIIERIHLINFMSHANLEVELGPQINFITGVNGSGKSAILVGLSLCLGANTSFAQRSNRLGEFVRTGTQKAVVSVTLRNVGLEAFKPELYGDSITVERTILVTGSSKYKLKGHHGRVVTTERSELAPLCDRFNIQINNPCIIMMQETSRDFLGNSSAAKKYELFERATQIRVIQDHLSELMGDIANAASTLDRKRSLFPALQRKHEIVKKEHDEIMHLKKVKENMVNIKGELVWAQVQEREAHVALLVKGVEDKEEMLARNTERLKEGEARLEAKVAEDERLAQELAALGRTNDALTVKITQLRDDGQSVIQARDKTQRELNSLPRSLELLKNRIRKLEETIAQEAAKQAGALAKEEVERLKKLQQAKDLVFELQSKLDGLQGNLPRYRDEVKSLQEEKISVVGTDVQMDKEVTKLRNQLANFSNAAKDISALWGAQHPQVRDLIQRHARDFKRPPIGPLGAHMKLTENSVKIHGQQIDVALLVEMVVGKFLPMYWCDNYEDNKTLQRLLDGARLGSVKTIIQPFRDVYQDLRLPKESKDYVRILDCFKCEPANVLNILVDQTSLESAVIASDGQFKEASLLDHQNVRRIFNSTGDVKHYVGRERGIKFVGAGARLTQSTLKQSSFGEENKGDAKKALERALKEATEKKAVSGKKSADLERRLRDAIATVKESEAEMYKLQDQLKAATSRMHDAQATNEHQDGNVEVKTKLAVLQVDFQKMQEKMRDGQQRVHSQEKEAREFEDKIAELQKELDEGFAKTQGLENKARELSKSLAKAKTDIANKRRMLTEAEKVIEEGRVEREAAKESLKSVTEIALKAFPDRVPVTKTVQELESIVAGMEAALLQQQKAKGKTIEQIEKEFLETKTKVRNVGSRLEWLQKTLAEISVGLNKRNESLDRMRKLIGETVSTFFNSYLTKKGYEGSAKFVHDKSSPSLEVQVNLNPGSQSQVSQNAQTLSGGETSFSTVALLLALWEVIDTPFRIMDEFDIFMDAVHRQLSLNVLIEFSRTSPHRQFIFLSPLDSSTIPRDPDIRIKRLEPPVRGNQQRITDML